MYYSNRLNHNPIGLVGKSCDIFGYIIILCEYKPETNKM